MIRSRQNIKKYFKIFNLFVWYKEVGMVHNFFYKMNFSKHRKVHWYDKTWMINAYIMRKFDDNSRRRRMKYDSIRHTHSIFLHYKDFHTNTKYCMVQTILWRKMKYGVLLNYIALCRMFLRYITKVVQFTKNDTLMFTNFYDSSLFSEITQQSNYVYEFKLSKRYWDNFFKHYHVNFILYQKLILKDSFFYSHYSSVVKYKNEFKLFNINNLYKFNATLGNSFNIKDESIKLPETVEQLNEYNDDYNYILNKYTYDYTKMYILEVYKSTILITLNSLKN